jgi:oligopeptide transport system ATP-binding protein
MSQSVLSVRNLTTRFRTDRGSVLAVDSVSFELAAGETLAIVGESGSGKSVTAMSIMRLIPSPPGRIEQGEVLLEGRDLLKLSEAEMRAVLGFQIAEPMNVHRRTPWRDALNKAVELITRVRMPDAESRRDAYPHQFSGGMRQRAMIAMALACQPQLIIADEPTTALDVTVQAQILDLLKELAAGTRSALILITHDLGVVARYADRVAVMYAGRIVESAPARVLYAQPKHPYTLGLIQSAPRLDGDSSKRLIPIEGQPPDLRSLPPGCSFAPRCRYVTERCRSQRPELREVAPGHQKACFVDV